MTSRPWSTSPSGISESTESASPRGRMHGIAHVSPSHRPDGLNVPPAWPSPRRHSREVPVTGSLSVSSSPTVRFEAGNNSKGCEEASLILRPPWEGEILRDRLRAFGPVY